MTDIDDFSDNHRPEDQDPDEHDYWQEYKDDRAQGYIDEHGNPITPEPPEDYYDHVPAGNEPAGRQWSSEPPFPDDRPAPTTDVDYCPPFRHPEGRLPWAGPRLHWDANGRGFGAGGTFR
ncbi:hypothetical protein AF335_06210 [Streptomyces eurocidicus]|uniref:Uncharacterized protein n=1 Tax=Streptomyces eurocidicus TaxID=66423 RepID=A0A2N8NZN6_STREU|nr:hypothetical protein [Streptomyces eurocidicus]MBB5118721.1 hypothetical protein [Streptomyces eurocidicus]MBF6051467.1 hypothetical protein [Streptomyces eurocidicus]PNE34234.1 hypothetical protein AF335_06210 [Streptomyces eurocidicus]